MPTHLNQICTTPSCPRPTNGDGFLCRTCTDDLYDALAALLDTTADKKGQPSRDLLAELELTITGQTRIRSRNSGIPSRGTDWGLPWNEYASTVAAVLIKTLTSWVHTFAGYHGFTLHFVPGAAPRDAAAWLIRHLPSLRTTTMAGEAAQEIIKAVNDADRAVDRPADRAYCGPCHPDCGGQVYANMDEGRSCWCNTCGARYNTADRRDFLLQAAEDYELTAAEASRAMPALLGRALNVKTIRGWANADQKDQERMRCRGYTDEGTALYRLGDIIERAKVAAIRHHTRRKERILQPDAICA